MKNGKILKISIIAISILIAIIVAAIIFAVVLNNLPHETQGPNNNNDISNNDVNTTENQVTENTVEGPEGEAKISYVKTSDGGEIPVPEGFTYVEGGLKTGAVIKDEAGNEFVWVPLLNNLYTRRTFTDPNSVVTNETEPDPSENTTQIVISENENAEYTTSVNKYKGFYIGRYEASKNEENEGTVKTIKGVVPWTEVTFGRMKEAAEKTYKADPSVTSDLPSSYDWDLMCKWLQDTGYNIYDSTQYGNYTDNREGAHALAITGRNSKWVMNNIYDIAGNAWELTTETWKLNGKKNHTGRGGGYTSDGKQYPVSCKMPEYDGVYTYIGFRIVLYLN